MRIFVQIIHGIIAILYFYFGISGSKYSEDGITYYFDNSDQNDKDMDTSPNNL